MKRKVVHIITGLHQAGAETLLFRLINSDNSHIHEVVSLTDFGYYGKELSSRGFVVHEIRLNSFRFIFGLFNLLRLVAANRKSSFHCWMYHANLIGGVFAKAFAVKNVIWSVHHLNSATLSGSTRAVAKLCNCLSSIIPSKTVFVSEESLHCHVEDGFTFENTTVIHNFVDTNIFIKSDSDRINFREMYAIPQNAFVFGSVARWHPVKGHRTLIKAFSLLVNDFPNDDYRLVLIGAGINDNNSELRQLLATNNVTDRVTLIDAHPNPETLYPGMDAHILASQHEAFGMATLEAISCGVPVISSNVGFANQFISNNRLLFEVENSVQLRSSMRYASTQPTHAIASKAITKFSMESSVEHYCSIW